MSPGIDRDPVLRRAMSLSFAVLVLAFACLGVARAVFPADSLVFDIVKFVFALTVIASSYLWCLFDSLTHDFRFGRSRLFLFVFVLPVALVFCFYRSRTPKEATTTAIKALAFFVLLILVSAASQVTTARLLGSQI
jgi:hypothetical protein